MTVAAMQELHHEHLVIFQDRPVVLPVLLVAASVMFAIGLSTDPDALLGGEREAIGMLLGAVMCAFGAVLLFRRDEFAFDRQNRRLTWRKWMLASASSGEVGFDEILDVTVESISAGEGGGTYRVALRMPDRSLALTESYAGTADDWRPLIARIREIVGLGPVAADDGDTDALLVQGRKIDAIRQLRETEGASLTKARSRSEAQGRTRD